MIRRRALFGGTGMLIATTAAAQVPGWYASGMKQRELRFPGANGATLAGTLVLPLRSEIQPVPGVVLIAGSGPTDRDGNNPGVPVKIDLLKQVAERLADAGIATLRYDKRGIGQSSKPPYTLVGAEAFFAWKNFIGDVQLAHAELIKHSEIKSYATALLGHSEGGLLAIAAAQAASHNPPYALVLAGTPGLPLGKIIREQLARNAPVMVEPAVRIMAEIARTGHAPADVPPELAPYFPPYIGPLFRDELDFDPAPALASLTQPCLLVHGGADTQIVPFADIQPLLDVLAKRTASGEVVVVPAVSHNLKTVSSPTDPGFAGPLAPAVGTKLAEWLAYLLRA